MPPRPSLRSRPVDRVVLALAVLAALGGAVLGVAVRGHVGDTRIDSQLATPVIALFRGHRRAVVTMADLGGPVVIALSATLLATILGVGGRWRDAVAVVLSPALAGLLTQLVLKPLVDRPLNGTPAWPSGHATGTWALVTAILVLLLREGPTRCSVHRAVVVVGLGGVSAVGLVGAQYHFLTDVVGGVAVGVAVGCVVAIALRTTRRES